MMSYALQYTFIVYKDCLNGTLWILKRSLVVDKATIDRIIGDPEKYKD